MAQDQPYRQTTRPTCNSSVARYIRCFYKIQRLAVCSKKSIIPSNPSHFNLVHTITQCFLKICFNIILRLNLSRYNFKDASSPIIVHNFNSFNAYCLPDGSTVEAKTCPIIIFAIKIFSCNCRPILHCVS
jgi:hypothetical protein